MNRHESLQEWQRRVALDIAQAHPLEPVKRICATGNHRAAQNDEPEPSSADDPHLAEVAVESATEYAQRRARENDARARELDMQRLDVMRRAGL